MEYLLNCQCGKQLRVSKSQAGGEIQCQCGNRIQIPTLRGFNELPAAPSETQRAASASPWKGWRSPALAICATLLVLSGFYSAWKFLQSYRNQLNYSVEDFIAEGNAAIDQFGPDELSITWNEFETIWLVNRTSPTFHIYNIYSREQKVKGFIGLGVMGLLALVSAAIVISARTRR